MTVQTVPAVEEFFQRSLTAHLPDPLFRKLQNSTVLMGGVGGGSNMAELMARKGIGHVIVSDLDRYECHNIRQRCSLVSTLGVEKVVATQDRLLDVNPHIRVTPVREGITLENADGLVRRSDVVVDMLDLHAIKEKVALHRAARRHRKYVLTAPSVINGAVLWTFGPDGMTFEEFTGYDEGKPLGVQAWSLLRRMIPRFPREAPEEMYREASYGTRTIPLDACGVDQSSVMVVAQLENILLGRMDRVVTVPRGIHADMSDPAHLADIVTVRMEREVCHGENCG